MLMKNKSIIVSHVSMSVSQDINVALPLAEILVI